MANPEVGRLLTSKLTLGLRIRHADLKNSRFFTSPSCLIKCNKISFNTSSSFFPKLRKYPDDSSNHFSTSFFLDLLLDKGPGKVAYKSLSFNKLEIGPMLILVPWLYPVFGIMTEQLELILKLKIGYCLKTNCSGLTTFGADL